MHHVGDITLAEPSLVGFAGQAIVKNQTRENLPEGFQSSRTLLEKGMCRWLYHRKEINHKIKSVIKLLLNKNTEVNSLKYDQTSEVKETREAS